MPGRSSPLLFHKDDNAIQLCMPASKEHLSASLLGPLQAIRKLFFKCTIDIHKALVRICSGIREAFLELLEKQASIINVQTVSTRGFLCNQIFNFSVSKDVSRAICSSTSQVMNEAHRYWKRVLCYVMRWNTSVLQLCS